MASPPLSSTIKRLMLLCFFTAKNTKSVQSQRKENPNFSFFYSVSAILAPLWFKSFPHLSVPNLLQHELLATAHIGPHLPLQPKMPALGFRRFLFPFIHQRFAVRIIGPSASPSTGDFVIVHIHSYPFEKLNPASISTVWPPESGSHGSVASPVGTQYRYSSMLD